VPGDEDRMAAHRRLAPVIDRLSRREALSHETARMVRYEFQTVLV
jgi:hypothetical protein